jgi:uncharacterized membrane protein YeaQ/YmgE (transglycosylase-associated protein family)
MFLTIIYWIVVGLIVGVIARLIVPGRQPMGWIATILLGVAGSFVGGSLGTIIFNPDHKFHLQQPSVHTWLGSLVGAVLLLLVYRLVTSRTRTL